MKVYTPKDPAPVFSTMGYSVFLGGSIEMGKAIDWQAEIISKLEPYDIEVYNPRRDDWDSSWVQSIDNPQFKAQVEWELNCQDVVDKILYYFVPNTYSPITLLELGLFANKDVGVVCPDGFWRKGNVDIVTERYYLKKLNNIDEAVEWIVGNE